MSVQQQETSKVSEQKTPRHNEAAILRGIANKKYNSSSTNITVRAYTVSHIWSRHFDHLKITKTQ